MTSFFDSHIGGKNEVGSVKKAEQKNEWMNEKWMNEKNERCE